MSKDTVLQIRQLSAWYGTQQSLKDVSVEIPEHSVTAVIGPSGCGKSTLIRCFNRMNDFIVNFKRTGQILFKQNNIDEVDITKLRLKIGMVFQKQNPFPKSIYENVAYGPKVVLGIRDKAELNFLVEDSLKRAAIWNEVKDKLHKSAMALSGGQQQRLCIARSLAIKPELLLLDEPCSALDPMATAKIEELIQELKHEYSIMIVTHNMQQAARVSDYTVFMLMGEMIEFGETETVFTVPKDKRTEDYITGKFG